MQAALDGSNFSFENPYFQSNRLSVSLPSQPPVTLASKTISSISSSPATSFKAPKVVVKDSLSTSSRMPNSDTDPTESPTDSSLSKTRLIVREGSMKGIVRGDSYRLENVVASSSNDVPVSVVLEVVNEEDHLDVEDGDAGQ